MAKKVWEKPNLVAIVRGRPEEAVLVTCKYSTKAKNAGPADNNKVTCNWGHTCGTCNENRAS